MEGESFVILEDGSAVTERMKIGKNVLIHESLASEVNNYETIEEQLSKSRELKYDHELLLPQVYTGIQYIGREYEYITKTVDDSALGELGGKYQCFFTPDGEAAYFYQIFLTSPEWAGGNEGDRIPHDYLVNQRLWTQVEGYDEIPGQLDRAVSNMSSSIEMLNGNFSIIIQRVNQLPFSSQQVYYHVTIDKKEDLNLTTNVEHKALNARVAIILATTEELRFWHTPVEDSISSTFNVYKYKKSTADQNECWYYIIDTTPAYRRSSDYMTSRLPIQFRFCTISKKRAKFALLAETADTIVWPVQKNFITTFEYGIKTLTWIRNGVRTIVLTRVPGRDYTGKVAIKQNSITKAEVEVQIKKGSKLITLPEGINPDSINKLDYDVKYDDPWSPPVEDKNVTSTDTGTEFFHISCTGNSMNGSNGQVELGNNSPITYSGLATFQYIDSDDNFKSPTCMISLKLGSKIATILNDQKYPRPTGVDFPYAIQFSLDLSKV